MDPDRVSRALRTTRFGRPLIWRGVVDSTSTRLVELARREPLPEGATLVAGRQTRGRGTAGKAWLSDDDRGLWLSVLLREPIAKHPLSFVPAIALVEAVRDVAGVDAWLKWPNDVLVDDRKLAGVLVESAPSPGVPTAWIVGVGLNVGQTDFPPEIRARAVSLRLVTGAAHDLGVLLATFLERFEDLYDDPRFEPVAAFRERTRMLGRRLRARRGGRSLEVVARDLTPEGHLEVLGEDGGVERWVSATDLDIERIE